MSATYAVPAGTGGGVLGVLQPIKAPAQSATRSRPSAIIRRNFLVDFNERQPSSLFLFSCAVLMVCLDSSFGAGNHASGETLLPLQEGRKRQRASYLACRF